MNYEKRIKNLEETVDKLVKIIKDNYPEEMGEIDFLHDKLDDYLSKFDNDFFEFLDVSYTYSYAFEEFEENIIKITIKVNFKEWDKEKLNLYNNLQTDIKSIYCKEYKNSKLLTFTITRE